MMDKGFSYHLYVFFSFLFFFLPVSLILFDVLFIKVLFLSFFIFFALFIVLTDYSDWIFFLSFFFFFYSFGVSRVETSLSCSSKNFRLSVKRKFKYRLTIPQNETLYIYFSGLSFGF